MSSGGFFFQDLWVGLFKCLLTTSVKRGGKDNKKANNAEHKILGANVIFKRKWLTLVVTLVQLSSFVVGVGLRDLSCLTTFLPYYFPYYFPSLCCCSVTKLCLTLCNPTDCSTSGFPVLHYLLEFVQTHVHWVSDAMQPSHPLSPLSFPALNLSQHQGLFQWVSSSHQVPKVLEFQLHYQSFQWIFRVDFL